MLNQQTKQINESEFIKKFVEATVNCEPAPKSFKVAHKKVIIHPSRWQKLCLSFFMMQFTIDDDPPFGYLIIKFKTFMNIRYILNVDYKFRHQN